MEPEASELVISGMVTVFGLIGLMLAAHARDLEMSIFGLSLAGFAVLFVAARLRRHYNLMEAGQARDAATGGEGRHG